jgi:hypothetical protein
MAIDIWKLGGQSSNFSPLTSAKSLAVPYEGTFLVTFQAKSDLNGVIFISGDFDAYFELTPELKEYSCEMSVTFSSFLGIVDDSATGDVIIKNMKVVEVPLGKATINGIEGFGTLGPNAWHTENYDALPDSTNSRYPLKKGVYQIEYEGKASAGGAFTFSGMGEGVATSVFHYLEPEWDTYVHRISLTHDSDYLIYDGEETFGTSIRNLKIRLLDTKWTLSDNARVIDDETLELKATGPTQPTILQDVKVKGGQTVVFSRVRINC